MIAVKELFSAKFSGLSQTIASMFTLPTIGLPTAFSEGSPDFMEDFTAIKDALAPLGLYRGIPIYASSQKEIGENSIGKQIMLRSKELGTQVVTDNIAPAPRVWEIEGYLGLSNQNIASMMLQKVSFANNIAVSVFLQAIKDYFRYLRVLRAPFQFISREGDVYDVLMQSYIFEDEPISDYATKVKLTLMEYVALSISGSSYYIKNTPGIGSPYGMSAKYVSVAGTQLASSLVSMIK